MSAKHCSTRALMLPCVLVILGLGAPGCSLATLVDESQEQAERTIELVCTDCDSLYPDREECEDLFAAPYPDDECTVDALERDRAGSRATLECIIDAQEDYNACLEDKLDCEDPDVWSSCGDRYDAALVACPALAGEVVEALAACL